MKNIIKEKHIWLWMVLTFVYSLFIVFGRMFDKYGYICWDSNLNILWMLIGIVSGIPIAFLVDFIKNKRKQVIFNTQNGFKIKDFLIVLLINYAILFIILLGVYPGFFVYDAQDELLQVITRNFSTHHPLLHVLYLGGIIQAGYKVFGTYNIGIFIFMMFQALCFSYGNTRMLEVLKKYGISRVWIIITGVFLLLFPPMQMMSLCSTKDSIFALCVMMWVIAYLENKELRMTFWAIWICMFRNNASYALIVFMVILLIYKKRKLAGSMLIAFLISFVLAHGLQLIFHATPGGKQEMLTVPIQQVSRMYTYYDEENGFSDEEKEILYSYIPEEYLAKYRPKVADYLKFGFNNETYAKDKNGFWGLWLKGLKKNPTCYLNAWMMTSYSFWYPYATIDAYKGNIVFTFVYDESCYFGYETEEPGSRESKIPFIDNYFRYLSLENIKEDIPILAFLLSPGLVCWIYLFAFVYMITNKKERNELPFIYLLLVWLTLILGPLSLPRYVFFMWYSLPLLMLSLFRKA